jgi:hypothetical protein
MPRSYADAPHVDVLPFYARRPCVGKFYRLLGHGGVAAAILAPEHCLPWVLAAALLAWFAAWIQVVGTLWRATLVATLVACAVRLTLARLVAGS